MKTNAIAALLSAICAIFFCNPSSSGQGSQAFDTLNVSGTAIIGTLGSGTASIASGTINTLFVTGSSTLQGPVDLFANNLLFGSRSDGQRGLTFTYTDSVSTPSVMEFIANRPSFEWRWERPATSGTGVIPMMRLNSNHVLTLFDSTGNPAVVLDPSNQGGSTGVLTQQVADSRYVSSAMITSKIATGTAAPSPSIAFIGGTASGAYSFAGIKAIASGNYSVALGLGAVASNQRATAIACNAKASGPGSIAVGFSARASADMSAAIGIMSETSAVGSTAIGNMCYATGSFSFASGIQSTTTGFASTAFGVCPNASGYESTSIGCYAISGGDYSTAIGLNSTSAGCGQIVVGQCNVPGGDPHRWIPTDDLFIIGNGTFTYDPYGGGPLYDQNGNLCQNVQSNAFVVKKNGNTTIYGEVTISGTNGGVNAITSGGLIVTGTSVSVATSSGTGTKIVASGSSQWVLIPEQGDLSMGDFINGKKPIQ